MRRLRSNYLISSLSDGGMGKIYKLFHVKHKFQLTKYNKKFSLSDRSSSFGEQTSHKNYRNPLNVNLCTPSSYPQPISFRHLSDQKAIKKVLSPHYSLRVQEASRIFFCCSSDKISANLQHCSCISNLGVFEK